MNMVKYRMLLDKKIDIFAKEAFTREFVSFVCNAKLDKLNGFVSSMLFNCATSIMFILLVCSFLRTSNMSKLF